MPSSFSAEVVEFRRSYTRVSVNGDLSTWEITGPALNLHNCDAAAEDLVAILRQHDEPVSLVATSLKRGTAGGTITVVVQRSIFMRRQAG